MAISMTLFLPCFALLLATVAEANVIWPHPPPPSGSVDFLSVMIDHELCGETALAKMSPICRLVCQTVCGLFKAADAGRNGPQFPPYQYALSYKLPIYQTPHYSPQPRPIEPRPIHGDGGGGKKEILFRQDVEHIGNDADDGAPIEDVDEDDEASEDEREEEDDGKIRSRRRRKSKDRRGNRSYYEEDKTRERL